MNAQIPHDGTRANNTYLSFSSRSELANQLLLLSQDQELLPKDLEAPIISQVLDLPFIDNVDRQIFCHDLRLLILLECFPLDGLVKQLSPLIELLRRHSPLAGLRTSLLTLAAQTQQGLAYFPLIKEFLDHSKKIPCINSSWSVVLQLLIDRKTPDQIAKLTLGSGLDVLPDPVKMSMNRLLFSQIRVLSCLQAFKNSFSNSDWLVIVYIVNRIRLPQIYAFCMARILKEFILNCLPLIKSRVANFRQDESFQVEQEDFLPRLFHLFSFWVFHSHPETLPRLESSLPGYLAYLDPDVDYQFFHELHFEKILQYLPPYLLWNSQHLSFRNLPLVIHLAAGKNLRKFPRFILPISKRMAHEFYQLQVEDTEVYHRIYHGLTLAYLNTFVPTRFRSLYPYLQDYICMLWLPWEMEDTGWTQYQFRRWDVFLRKIFSLPLPDATEWGILNGLFRYFSHLVDERIEWSLRGATWNSMIRRTNEWSQARLIKRSAPILASKWAPKSYPGFEWYDAEGVLYTISELTTAKALRQEGFNMNHCVATYQDLCIKGHFSIWSLRKWENKLQKRLLTISVNQGLEIGQMQGQNNREATSFERNIVQQWALTAKLVIAKGAEY